MTTRSLGSSLVVVAIVVLFTSSGCAGVTQHVNNWCYGLSLWSQQKHELADVRQDTRQALAEQERQAMQVQAQREIEQARLDSERRRLEVALCLARQEQEQRRLKEQMHQALESKIAFNVQQQLQVGELEVDTEALKQLLEKREQEQRQPPTQPQEVPKKPCPCCDQPCDCGSGFIRRLCPHCRHKPCQAEHDCGGPAMLTQLQEQPQKQPLRPAEIPLKLPVRLSMGFQQPQIEQAQVRIQPPPIQEQKVPCGHCPRCGMPAGTCQCPSSCVNPAPGTQGAPPPGNTQSGGPGGADQFVDPLPPTPEPDTEANRAGGAIGNPALPSFRPLTTSALTRPVAYPTTQNPGIQTSGGGQIFASPFAQLGSRQP